MSELKTYFENEVLIHFGKKLLLTAEEIYNRAVLHSIKMENTISEFYKSNKGKFELINIEKNSLPNCFSICSTLFRQGPIDVKTYWLEFIFKTCIFYSYENRDDKRFIMDIAKDFDFLFEYSIYDFQDDKFKMTYPHEYNKSLNLTVPFHLNKLLIDLAIKIIEEHTTSKVASISLWYYDETISIEPINNEITVALDKDKYNSFPVISKYKFDSTSFVDLKQWYLEIPEFKTYIDNSKMTNPWKR
jgi:hypothetical protein